MAEECLDREDRALEVGRQDFLDELCTEVANGRVWIDASIGAEDVEPAQLLLDLVGKARALTRVGDITDERVNRCACPIEFSLGRGQPCLVASGDGNAGANPSKGMRDAKADALAAAGYQDTDVGSTLHGHLPESFAITWRTSRRWPHNVNRPGPDQ